MSSQAKQLPKDGHVIIAMMKDLGITEYEPRVVHQLLEFALRYITCVLDDSRAFANHSKKKTIDMEDVKLAISMQMDKMFSTPPSRDVLLEVSRAKNTVPLPPLKPHCGIRLPPDRYSFVSSNFKLKNKLTNSASFSYIKKPGGVLTGISLPGKNLPGPMTVVKRTTLNRSQTLPLNTKDSRAFIELSTAPGSSSSIVSAVAQKIEFKPQMALGVVKMEGVEENGGGLKRKIDEVEADGSTLASGLD